MLIVMKFGGTSVGSAERIAQAAQLAVDTAAKGHQVVVVTSAMSKVTDALIGAARQASTGHWDPAVRQQLFDRHKAVADALIGNDAARHATVLDALRQRLERFEKLCFGLSMVHELTPRLLDAISGTGEMLAAPLVAAAIAARGRASQAVDATELIVTTERDGGAEPLMDETRVKTAARLARSSRGRRYPCGDRLCRRHRRRGDDHARRGGSDYSASIVAPRSMPPKSGSGQMSMAS
jgi:aspartate kinase